MKRLTRWAGALALVMTAGVQGQISLVGPQTQGGLLHGKVAPGSKVWLNDKSIKVSADGVIVMGFGRDAELSHRLRVQAPDNQVETRDITLEKREYRIQRVTGIPKKIMQPKPENIARARKDSQQVRAARAQWSDNTHFLQDFIWPATGPISGVYGSQRYYNGKPGRPHYGVDVAGPTGTLVVAPADGIVTLFVPDMFYSGGTLIIDHGMGVNSTFLHLSKGLVKPGDVVRQGDPIAEIGASGRATGPHLDWRMNWFGERLDPQLLVPEMVVPDSAKK